MPKISNNSYFQYFYMTFGERILSVRKRLKWSQDELAKKVGTSAPIIGRYERNEIKPAIDTAKAIADALGVTIDFLLGGDDMIMDKNCLLYTSPSPRDQRGSRMPSSA